MVDDNSDAADSLGLVLEDMGHQVTVAYKGESAIEAAHQHRPQVAFIDLTMPGMSGGQVARELRQRFSPAELTLVALSGHARSHPAAHEAAFDYYLMKPADAEDVADLLKSL